MGSGGPGAAGVRAHLLDLSLDLGEEVDELDVGGE